RKCAAAICRSPASPDRDTPIASASSSSGKNRRTGTRVRKGHTESRSPYGRWKKYIFATIRAHDAHEQRRARAVRDGFQQKWKRPFQKKVTVQYLEPITFCKA